MAAPPTDAFATDAFAPILARIRAKLDEVRARGVETFGSDRHEFVLGAPVAEDELRAYEAQLGVALPPDFRAFVTRLGGSGAAPYYGLLPMSEWFAVAEGEHAKERPIAIVDQGCAYWAALVLQGAHAGRILYVNLDGGTGYLVESDDFLSWYERWLDELLWGHRHFWFGADMPGDEATLRDALRGPRRVNALGAMWRLPGLTDDTAAAVLAYLDADDAALRTHALRLVIRHARASVDLLRARLGDDHGEIRKLALEQLIKSARDWQEDARRALDDRDPAIVAVAIRALAAAGALDVDALLIYLAGPERAIVSAARGALYAHRSPRVFDALRALLDDALHSDLLGELVTHVTKGATRADQTDAIVDLVIERFTSTQRRDDLEDWRAARHLIRELGELAPFSPRAAAAIVDAARHPDAFVRFDAARLLGTVGGEAATRALIAMCDDPTMPKDVDRGTVRSVGDNARLALETLRARR